jgi:hypothetical protein
MAKKKSEYSEMSEEQLQVALEESRAKEESSVTELIEKEIRSRAVKDKGVKPKAKEKYSLANYKKKINLAEAKYKPQGWVDMSPAFKTNTNLP